MARPVVWIVLIMITAVALVAVAPPACSQGFVRWDYQRILYFPAGGDFCNSAVTIGTSDRIGQVTARSFWSYLDDRVQRPALNRFELHLDGIPLLGRRWDLSLGDIRQMENSDYTRSTEIRGLAVSGNFSPSVSGECFAGRAADIYSGRNVPAFRNNDWFLSQSVRVNVQKGLTLKHWLTGRRDGRQPLSVSGRSSAATLAVLSSTVEADLLPWLSSRGFVSLSRAGYQGAPSSTDANCGGQWGLNLAAYRASLSYQYKGSNYVGPANDGRENGFHLLSLSGGATVLPRLGLNAGYSQRWTRPAAAGSGSVQSASQTQRWFAGFSYNRADWPTASYSLERYAADNRTGSAAYRTRQWRHSLGLSRSWRGYNLQAGYQNLRSRGQYFDGGFNLSNQFTVSADRRWDDWQFSVSQQLHRQTFRRQLQWLQTVTGDLRWEKYFSNGLSLSWSQARAEGIAWGTEYWGWDLSRKAEWPSGWSLAASAAQRYYEPSYLTPQFRSLLLSVKLEKRFSKFRDFLNLGVVRGLVFEDNNGNGRRDPDEPGVKRLAVLLDGVRKTVTGDDGGYHLGGITPGRHTITVDTRTLSASLDPADQGGKSFTSAGVWGPRLDFPITPLNKVCGVVFADLNRNGAQDASEPGLPGVYVLMGDKRAFTSTDEEGGFKFFNIRPGRYPVYLDPKFLPDTLEVLGPSRYTVEVEDLKKVPLVFFGIARRVRPVRRIVFPPSVTGAAPAAMPAGKPQQLKTRVKPGAQPQPAEISRLRALGIRQYSGGQYQQALQTWQQLLKLDPNNAEAKRNLLRTQQKLDAIRNIQR